MKPQTTPEKQAYKNKYKEVKMTNYQYEDKKTNNLVKQVVGTLSRRMGLSGQSESGIKMKTAEDLAWRESIRSIDLAYGTGSL